jgi:hypothetical protein
MGYSPQKPGRIDDFFMRKLFHVEMNIIIL